MLKAAENQHELPLIQSVVKYCATMARLFSGLGPALVTDCRDLLITQSSLQGRYMNGSFQRANFGPPDTILTDLGQGVTLCFE